MSNPKITLAVAAYNIAEFLPKCLDSLLVQTYQKLEILVIDDGSTDDTSKICDEYAKKDSRVKVIHQNNQGLAAVRNLGIRKSTGEYLAFIDGDDYVDKNYAKRLFDNLNDADVVVCGFETIPTGHGESFMKRTISGAEAARELLLQQTNAQIVSWNKLQRKTMLKNITFPVGKKNEDNFTTYKILSNANKVSFINDKLYYYQQRSNSIMNVTKIHERLNNRMCAALEAKEYFKDNKESFAAAEIAELLAHFAFIDQHIDRKKHFAWIKNNRKNLLKNQFVTTKLRLYIILSTTFGGFGYKIFRLIKH